jgi:hypothetical protein
LIVVAMTALGIASALWSPARVRRLAAVRLAHVELVWIALVLQVLLFEWWARHLPMWATETLHYLTYGLCAVFVVLNRTLPGTVLIAIGASSNLIAIAANGGSMPADPDAWALAGHAPVAAGTFENSANAADANLAFLGDIFAIPAGWPLANVFSIGDVLIVIGGTWFAHRWCAGAGRLDETAETEAPSLTPA